MKIINLLILIEKKNRSIELIFEFSNNVYKDINIFLRLIFADNQNKRFQFEDDGVENVKIPRFIFFELFLNIKNINVIFDFILKVVFVANSHHRVDFIIYFDSN